MTKEEAIKILNTYDVNFHNEEGHKIRADKICEACDMGVKALEQTDVLDKIRAEIEALEEGIWSYHNDRPWVFKDEVLQIIDKYKAESEET